jgi:DNA-binding XRE family transcriptional regulator
LAKRSYLTGGIPTSQQERGGIRWSHDVGPTDVVEIEAGARRLLAQARGHQLAEIRKQLALGQKQIASAMGVSVARVSQIEHVEVTSVEVIARYVGALGGRLDLVADFGDRTVRLPVSDTATAA